MVKAKMSELDWAAWVFVILGAINWGLVGIAKLDVVQIVFGTSPVLLEIVYLSIGLSGLYWLYKMVTDKK